MKSLTSNILSVKRARRSRRFEIHATSCDRHVGTGRAFWPLKRRKPRALVVQLSFLLALLSCVNMALAQATDTPSPAPVQEEFTRARAEAERAKADVQKQQEIFTKLGASFGGAGGGGGPFIFSDRLQHIIGRAPAKTLVVRSSDLDAKAQSNLEEDLAVMSHILDKALQEVGDDGAHVKPMGINVLFSPGSASFNNLYLEGYGALFILHVRLPLLPPPAKPAREKEKPAADSTWQEAWQELYGGRPGEKPAMEPAIEYSEEKVTRLKESLVEALKNATNLRDLKPEESVTVCVFGDGGVRFAKTAAFSGTDPAHKGEQNRAESVVRTWAVAGNGTHTGSATMTIRVKKADVDAFAKGKLTLQEFQKKAKIAIYEGGPQKAGSPAAGLVGP